jgi:hypothetical protein
LFISTTFVFCKLPSIFLIMLFLRNICFTKYNTIHLITYFY